MKKPQSKPAVDAGLVSLDASDLLRPSVFAAISELPEHRRVLYLARVRANNQSRCSAEKWEGPKANRSAEYALDS
jgi:hypothetical protein